MSRYVVALLVLPGCFYAKIQAGYAPATAMAPAAVVVTAHEGIIATGDLEIRPHKPHLDISWFGKGPVTWGYGLALRGKAGPEQAQLAIGPELTVGLNPSRSAVVPYLRGGVHALQGGWFRGDWEAGAGSPFGEVGLATCAVSDDNCLSASFTAEYDLRFGPAPSTAHLGAMLGIGVGF